jgi:hypothetical protein
MVKLKEVGTEIGRDLGQDMVSSQQNSLFGEVEAHLAARVARCGDDFEDPVPQGVPAVGFEMAVNPEGNHYLPKDSHVFNQGVQGLLRKTLAEAEIPGSFGKIFQSVVVLKALVIDCRQANHGPGAFLDFAGNPTVIGMEVGQEDLVDVLYGLAQGCQRLVKHPKRFGDVYARVKQGHLAIMHQNMDVNVTETKGHRQGNPVKIGQDLIDQKVSNLQSMGIFKIYFLQALESTRL